MGFRLALLVVLLAACRTVNPQGDRNVHKIGPPPPPDRCARQKTPAAAKRCSATKEEAYTWVRRLSVDDQLCLDGEPGSIAALTHCKTRGFVDDVAANSVRIEIREAPQGSRFKPMDSYWFHEDALMDLYLMSAGF